MKNIKNVTIQLLIVFTIISTVVSCAKKDEQYYIAHGVVYLDEGDFSAALESFNDALRLNPQSREGFNVTAR